MMLVGLFLLIFLFGPVAFRQMTVLSASDAGFRLLICVMVICGGAALGLRYGFPQRWGQSMSLTIAGIAFIWWSWIALLAFGVQTVRRVEPGIFMRRWSRVIGTAGTTAPWFGLAWVGQLLS